jgi:hypothetical protein
MAKVIFVKHKKWVAVQDRLAGRKKPGKLSNQYTRMSHSLHYYGNEGLAPASMSGFLGKFASKKNPLP